MKLKTYFSDQTRSSKISIESLNASGDIIPISHRSDVFGKLFVPITKLQRTCKTKGREGNVKPCKNQINQEISIHRGLHHCSAHLAHLDYGNALLYGLPKKTIEK